MSKPPFTMSKYARREDLLADAAQYYEAECLRLRLALEAAHAGLGMAYEALEKECYDEAMLHCGHHHAQTWKALLPNVQVEGAEGCLQPQAPARTPGSAG